ncbi:hypothetical protein [Lentibacillus sp. CBA3610]|uniref:hypothetical protein n=1 Tax=Lentibacillus sp. CBA3610 TaxID=2518176 RepID=UPI0015960DD1|nr:hypothetical protein [Lentibacillus sp. CBA3610]QKY68698.1 hypothetical protein Len3610_02830 [Lentibacillus sp. CBA3610]
MSDNQVLQAIKELQDQMNEGFEKVDKRFEQVDKRFESLEKRVDQMDTKIDGVQAGVDLLARKTWKNEQEVFIMKRSMGLD